MFFFTDTIFVDGWWGPPSGQLNDSNGMKDFLGFAQRFDAREYHLEPEHL